jgi:hypothetical protein
LSSLIRLAFIQLIFELGVPLAQESVKFGAVLDVGEVERLPRMENGRVLGEIPIVRVV